MGAPTRVMKKVVSTWILFSSVLALVLSIVAFAKASDKSTASPSAESKDRPALRGARALGPFTVFDSNHDGMISADEIRHAADALWRLDKNGDGTLTASELHPDGAPPPPPSDGNPSL